MLTGSESTMSSSLILSSARDGGGGFGFGFDFGFDPVEDLPETAPTTKDGAGVVTVKNEEDSWLNEKSEGFAVLKRYRFGVVTVNGY